MLTYATIDGRVLDLSDLTDEQRTAFDKAYVAYREGTPEATFNNRFVAGSDNPLLVSTGGRITRAVWDHPLYQAVHDLGARLGIQQGELEPEGDWERDPIGDGWISAPEAARIKGVTLSALHKAIQRGEVLGRPATGRGGRSGNIVMVSEKSLRRWSPNALRQAAGRMALRERR